MNNSGTLLKQVQRNYLTKHDNETSILSRIKDGISADMFMSTLTVTHGLSEFKKPEGPIITKDKVIEILLYLEKRYGYTSKVLDRLKTDIVIFNKTHKDFNSITFAMANQTALLLLLNLKKDEVCTPEWVFFHELGHLAVMSYNNGDLLTIPEIYKKALTGIGLDAINHTSVEDQREVLADFFATGLAYSSPYHTHNPYRELFAHEHIVAFHKIARYMLSQIKT